MNVSYEEIGRMAVTFPQSGCKAGQVCKVGVNGIVTPCSEGEKFCGIVESVRGGIAAVQMEGFVTVPLSGSIGTGYAQLSADGKGGVRVGTGREYLVVSADLSAGIALIKL